MDQGVAERAAEQRAREVRLRTSRGLPRDTSALLNVVSRGRKVAASVAAAAVAVAALAGGWLLYLQQRPYDVIAVLGQSNALGAGRGWNPSDLFASPKVAQEPSYSRVPDLVLPAFDPLLGPAPAVRPPLVGPGVELGERWADQTGRNVLLVPVAVSGTGFTPAYGYTWNPGDRDTPTNLFDQAVSEIREALARDDDNRLAAIVWHQGETDADAGMGADEYADHLTSVIEGLRKEFGDVPVVIGGMAPEWIAATPGAAAVAEAQAAVADSMPGVAFVPGPEGMTNGAGDEVHYSAAGQRELAARYAEAITSLG